MTEKYELGYLLNNLSEILRKITKKTNIRYKIFRSITEAPFIGNKTNLSKCERTIFKHIM
jgi:hypothetical protein